MHISEFENKHKGERCVILGNGPSLNDIDLKTIGLPTFGTNRIYLSGFIPTYYVAVNDLVLAQFGEEIPQFETIKFLPQWAGYDNYWGDQVVMIDTSLQAPAFSSPEGPIWEGHTVTYVCMQLAFYMGFNEVILLGLDHDYGPPMQPNIPVVAGKIDHYHFDPTYFSDGIRWHTPDLRMSEFAYGLARAAYEHDNRKIINCSTKTKCKVFDIEPFNYVVRGQSGSHDVSAIVSAYNSVDYIEGCINDLGAQTIGSDMEIVIVGQAVSKDVDLAMGIVADEDFPCDVRLIQTEDVPTVYEAWNMAIRSATGRYLTNANTDDRHHPEAYKIMAHILDTRSDIDLVYHDSFITWEPNQTFKEFIEANDKKYLVPGRHPGRPGHFGWIDYSRDTLVDGCYIGPHPMWRANLHQRYGYFMDHWKSAGDYEFWLRCMKDDNYYHIPYTMGLYCAREDGIELGDIATNMEESESAIILHQTPEVIVKPMGNGMIRIKIDGHYTNVHQHDLLKLVLSFSDGKE